MATRKTAAPKDDAPKAAKPATRKRAPKAAPPATAAIEITPDPAEAAALLREQIAVEAYLLWESGVPGDRNAHWLQAERELRSA
ncbi:MAG: DUF2934 domain-containing protein [Candidatus Nanopelagicales bacterium]